MSRQNSGVIARYVQQCIADGRQEVDGFFVFTRKEILDRTNIASSTFDRSIEEAMEIIAKHFDFCLNFHIPGYKINQENLFIDVFYQRGKLRFRGNPLSRTAEFSYMWDELTPPHPFFTYIYSTTYNDRNKTTK